MSNSKNIIINWIILRNYNIITEYNLIVGFYGMYKYKRDLTLNIEPHQSIFLWGARKTGKSTYLKNLYHDSILSLSTKKGPLICTKKGPLISKIFSSQ